MPGGREWIEMAHLLKTFSITPRDFVRAGEISIAIQGILKSVGFGQDVIRRASVCAYESEMNVVMHGGKGTFFLAVEPEMIVMEVADDGPGIQDIDLAMQEGYSTASPEYREIGFGAGMGLPNIKKNADEMEITSEKGKGTRVKILIRAEEESGGAG